MNNEFNSVGKTGQSGEQWSVGIAYIALPSDVEREIYIRECYQNSRVSIWSEDAGFLNRVPIDSDTINFIEFPEVLEKFGTAVVFVTEPIHKQPIIIGRLPKTDELGELKENQFKIKRKLGNKIVEISGSPEKGVLNLIVNAESEGGSINISLVNVNDNGELSLSVAGDVKIDATGNIEFLQKKRFYVNTVGEDGKDDSEASYEQTSEEHRFGGKKIIVNEGEDPMVLGNALNKILGQFIDKVAAITVTTVLGVSPILNAPDVLLLKKDLKNILSSEGFLKQ